MASRPDENPDSPPTGPSEDVEQVSPPDDNRRESVEDVLTDSEPDSPGMDGGTSGTGGTNHRTDRDITS